MSVRKLKGSWWVDFRVDYARYRRRSPDNSKPGAKAYEALLRQRLVRGEPIEGETRVESKDQPFESFAWTWFQDYVVSNNRKAEQRNKEHTLRAALVPHFGQTMVGTISSWQIERFKASELKRGISRKTINNRLTVLRRCLMSAYDWLALPGAVPRVTWLKCPPPRTDYLSQKEAARLLSAATGITHEMIFAALRTGMRQGELRGLQWESIDWQTHTIAVRHSRCDYTKDLVAPKSNRARFIPMDAHLTEVLAAGRREAGYVFADQNGDPLTGHCIERRLKVVCKKAGLRSIGWHTLRHTFASDLAMNGVPLNAVQALLGHSSITTTMRYAHLAPSALRAAIATLSPTNDNVRGQPVGNRWLKTGRGRKASNG